MVRLDKVPILNQRKPVGPGIMAIASDENGRYTRFSISVQGLVVPEGTRSIWQFSSDVPDSRNLACKQLLETDLDWIWFMDDDHVFGHDVLYRLLNRNVDIVGPVCLRRVMPFVPTACVDDEVMDVTRYGEDELVDVQHTGSAGMLIRRRVIEAVEPPWFNLDRDEDGNRISEDVVFCQKAKAAGFDIHVDMNVRIGHMTTTAIIPVWAKDAGRWLTGFSIADGMQLTVDPYKEPPPPPDGES